MSQHSKQYLAVLFWVLSAIPVLSQQVYSTHPDSATLFPATHGSFENYAFILNGKAIDQHALVEFPDATLNNVFPYAMTFEGRNYPGAVYLHTQERYAPPVRYADDPAYFINGTQVSPFHFRMAKVEAFTRMEKSELDTTINGMSYKGTIQVYTDEDFFAERMALPELIRTHTGLPPEKVIVHWRGPNYRYTDADDIGTIIRDHFPIYYFTVGRFDVRAVEVDRIQLAEGERYVVHVVDNGYHRSTPKGRLLFEDPLAIDTAAPCYVTDFDPEGQGIFTSTEIKPRPCMGKGCEADYLKKLSATLGLPADTPHVTSTPDSLTVQFIVLRNGMLTALKGNEMDKPGHEDMLQAIKKLACVWLPAVQGGRPVIARRKMKIHYRKDQSGNLLSLDTFVTLPVEIKTSYLQQKSHSRQENPTHPDSAALFPTTFGTFENDKFILNGGTIAHDKLADYPEAKLSKILPGAVYFHTPWYPPPPPRPYTGEPAYFINDTQVSPYTIRSSRAEAYHRIEKSTQDTVIDGTGYHGTIRVYTDEDFFAERIPLPELIHRHTGVPPEKVIVHWRSRYKNTSGASTIIHDRLPLYYINPKGLQAVEVDGLRSAGGERYVVHLADSGYRFKYASENGWTLPRRTLMIFADPATIDPMCPCYSADVDTTDNSTIYWRAKGEPEPYLGEALYLKNLSAIMGLPTDKPATPATPDSITVQFIMLKNGKLAGLQSTGADKPGHEQVLQAIKRHSCPWSRAFQGNELVRFRRRMTIFYSRDQHGNIQSLDALAYRYDYVP